MANNYNKIGIPRSRLATFDVYSVGKRKNHVVALLEFDVTEARGKIRALRRRGQKVSFNAWLLKAIANTITSHPEVASFRKGKRVLMAFKDVSISLLVEKTIDGKKVPIPVVLEEANKKSISELTIEIEDSKNLTLSRDDIVLKRKPKLYEQAYFFMPGFLRRMTWMIMLGKPKFLFSNMGNVSVTSVGMMGRVNGWFIHNTIHPISFGIGSVVKKPLVVNNEISVREVLNATILLDHDVIDGAPMVRFIKELTKNIEDGEFPEV
jgi:pyruvate/2-oxoglutarate dehydrogenase complex dihydrolipoamide acyltransferase (E2) component